jgi:hypothetical protein
MGTTIYADNGTPSEGIGELGSFYIDYSTGWLWRKI